MLHFGSALEIKKEEAKVKALVVCSSGIGSSKMLASRLKKESLEIESFDMSSLIELKGREVQSYDMIVSTVPIPYENIDYIMVSPLLNEEDANQVKQYIKRKIPLILEKIEARRKRHSKLMYLTCWRVGKHGAVYGCHPRCAATLYTYTHQNETRS